jgi:hypothetical protein
MCSSQTHQYSAKLQKITSITRIRYNIHGGAEEESMSSWPTSTWYCYFVWKHRSLLPQILMHPSPRMYVSFNAIAKAVLPNLCTLQQNVVYASMNIGT